MMYAGMGQAMFWVSLLATLLLLGFAYIVWTLASKETANTKLTGQIISGAIAILAIIFFLYGGIYGGLMGRGMHGYGMMGPGMMMGSGMMGKGMDYGDMQKWMKSPEMQKWMEEYGKKGKRK